jgi:DNA-directed RNA polymerase specialized sigma24 family protein
LTYAPLELRRAEVERLFLDPANYYELYDSIVEDRSLKTLFVMVLGDRICTTNDDGEAVKNIVWTINVADEAVQGVARHLDEYTGPIESSSFLDWAKPLAKGAAIRLSKFYQIIDEHKGAIRGGIRSALPSRNFFDDNFALVEEIFQEVAMLVMKYLDSLTEPSTAKLSVRLYGLARRHCLDYYVKKSRRRLKAVQRRLAQGGFDLPEVLSDLELASIRADEHEEIAS